ncbi:transketolase [Paenibacillus alba]|nr:transketolase [Paenibacillus alba]
MYRITIQPKEISILMNTTLDQKSVNTIRTLSIDAINRANSGHPGLPMGAAPMAYALWAKHLKHNPFHAKWFNRDRFVLSAGHGSALLYSLLHLSGYKVSMDDLKQFRKLESKTPGHPEYGHTDGVDATTGPLGQGIAMAVGMAMAEAHLAAKFNKETFPVVDHYTYALVGDGCLMEGISYEAMSMAGHMKLDKLIVLYDSNDISLDGALNVSYSDHAKLRAESANWQYLRVEDGNDIVEITKAIDLAKQDTTRPTLIEIRTVIGYGSPKVAGTNKAHGNPLGLEEAKATKEFYGWTHDEFTVPEEVQAHFENLKRLGQAKETEWNQLLVSYKTIYPELGLELENAINGKVLIENTDILTFDDSKAISTRVASGNAINHFMKRVPSLFGGSADLSHSTMTDIIGEKTFGVESYEGRNVYFGVREHAMGAAGNGMALHGGVIPFVSTFFVFSDYLRPSIRLAALQKLPVIYVFTHDSIAVGEDGPTHEPVEHLAALRTIPGLTVIRPGDANETASAWAYALQNKNGPVALVLSRQNLPVYSATKANLEEVTKGAYILTETDAHPDLIIIGTGSEVSLAVNAKHELEKDHVSVRVVAMPSMELFERQPASYKETVLPASVTKRVSIEAGISMGWERYVGPQGQVIAINTFGASGSGPEVMAYFGFSVENVVRLSKNLLGIS